MFNIGKIGFVLGFLALVFAGLGVAAFTTNFVDVAVAHEEGDRGGDRGPAKEDKGPAISNLGF